MSVKRLLVVLFVPLVLAAALAGLFCVRMPHVSVSLYDLIGKEAECIPSFLREASDTDVAVIVSSSDAAQATRVARRLVDESGLTASSDLPSGALEYFRANRGGLVTPQTAELLETAEGRAKLAKRAMRRLYLSPVPPVLGFADDPFGLTDEFLLSLSRGASDVRRTDEGFPILETNGVTRILLKASGVPTLPALELEEGVEIRLAGAPVHAARAAARSKTEIGLLTWFSLAFIALLSFVVFRSWRWIPLLTNTLAVAALAGGIALVVLFESLHVMTFVMGTTVLGLVVDYAFHWLLSPVSAKAAVRRNLVVSFLTTEISLVPLALATIPVLRQSAVFLGVGLAAALAFVLVGYPKGAVGGSCSDEAGVPRPRWKWWKIVCDEAGVPRPRRVPQRGRGTLASLQAGLCLLILFLMYGVFRIEIRTDLTALYRPPADLVEAERQRAAFGEFDFSAIPPLAVRQTTAENVRLLYAEHGVAMAETLGLASLVPPPEPTDAFVRPQTLMTQIFAAWTLEALVRLVWSVLALFGVLLVFFRGRAFDRLGPSVGAILVVFGLLGWLQVPVNLFHILATFLLLGMGVDYAVFLQSGAKSARRPAVCSLLTSLAGFGALAFVSFPVISAFGFVLGIGLPIAFGMALMRRRAAPRRETAERSDAAEGRAAGTSSVEKGASPFGLEILWLFYSVFGLRVLHLLAAAVGLCIWTFSPAVRRASPSWRKVVFFTQSLADKLVVMAEGRELPRVETDGSPDAEAFLSDVQTGKGVFILSSHVGTIEVLTALGACERTFHAWMDFDRTGVFNRFYLHHARRQRVVIHPILSFGMQTVFEAGDLIDAGDCLVMAGDRGDGAFRFAAAFDHPVYFVACVAVGACCYRAVIRRLPSERAEMKRVYESQVSELASAHPEQHFAWGRRNMI